ncbi:hypothetical protein ACFSJY_17305 [Thalassotalea euphylliae]|uniref:hypothetical protein n=1 Tax=Thalassotalea euphylliae TaxID=1655234 RepID=UPI003639078A
METMEKVMIIFAIASSIFALAWADKRFNLSLFTQGWMDCSDGFGGQSRLNKALKEKSAEVEALKQRVATLERIVTDPQEQLKREIDSL